MPSITTPPGPKQHWLRGNLSDFHSDRLGFLTDCARTYGDVINLRFGPRRVFVFNHPDLLEQVLVSQNVHFRKYFVMRLNPLVFGNGLVTSEGEFWLRQRRLIQPSFSRTRIATYAADMVQATDTMLSAWTDGQTREINSDMMQLTLAITAKTLFGSEAAGAAAEVSEALSFLQDNFNRRLSAFVPMPMWVPTLDNLRARKAVRRLDNFLYRLIQKRRATCGSGHDESQQASDNPRTDLLSLLIRLRDEDNGHQMTDHQLRDEAMTLFLGAYETTALALTWTWILLSQYPDVEARLAAEVKEVVGRRLPTFDDVSRLTFIGQVLHESMRLYPPLYAIGRESLADCEIGGYIVPRGTTIIMSQWVIQRDARFFTNPLEFDPSRWTPEFHQHLPKYAYFPFGGGPRVCIGNTFAMMEMTLILAAIAQRFCFTLKSGDPVKVSPSFTLRPRHGVFASITPRKQ